MNLTEKDYLDQIERQRAQDPLIGAKVCGQELYYRYTKGFSDSSGKVDDEILVLMASGMAGFACQVAVRERELPVTIKVAVSGKRYIFGESINKYLFNDDYSVWHIVAGIYHKTYPDKPIPDMKDVIDRVSANIGNEEYVIGGIAKAEDYVGQYALLWKNFDNLCGKFCKTVEEKAIAYNVALQLALENAFNTVGEKVFFLAMENAIFASKPDQTLIKEFLG